MKKSLTFRLWDSKEKFAENCNKLLSNKIADTFEDIDEEYELLYKADLNIVEPFELIENIDLDKLENNEILKTSIVCIQNNSFSQLINNLKNSDWVRNGLKYLESSTLCPFCQQELSQNIKHSLLEIFDETYNYQIKMLLDLKECYDLLTSRIFSHIKNIIEKNIDFLETKNIVDLQSKLQLIVTKNKVLFEKKINTPSEIIAIESIKDIVNCINKEIIIFNQKIHKNNNLAANQSRERTKLSNKSWDILVNNILYDTIKQYQNKISGINTGVFNLKNKIKLKQDKCDELQSQINTLQSKTSTIDNAINEINKALTAFAFTGFKLHKAEDGRNYKIIREDGSDVRETLSEGEQRFITFLYFYQLIQGNVEVENSTKQKIIVIDDPISSLDSNILFIVSTLVKNVISDCLSGEGLINQIFIMTHNIYFHQEVAFKSGRKNMSPNKECFWIIRKKDNISSIEISDTNLIQTSYELLWEEVRNTTKSSPASIFNTLRRILEYYFNIIGKLDYEKCINEMEGDDKILCKSLLSFINVNSHMINDDFMVISDEDTISKYIKIFEKIFEITGQKSHYDMMMQIKNED